MDIVTNSAGLITSYHMLDAVVRGMFTPPAEVTLTNTNTNTISGVLCIAVMCRDVKAMGHWALNIYLVVSGA